MDPILPMESVCVCMCLLLCPILGDPCTRLLCPGCSVQEYWSGLPFPPLGDLPDSVIELPSPLAPALAGRFFTTEPTEKSIGECLSPKKPAFSLLWLTLEFLTSDSL